MTIALIIIAIIIFLYTISLKLPKSKSRIFSFYITSKDKEMELKRLRKEILGHTGISKELIYSNWQIRQILDAHVKTPDDLIKLNIHAFIVKTYGAIILNIVNPIT